jgi:prepilin-type processing-associated H-X9-DG protein
MNLKRTDVLTVVSVVTVLLLLGLIYVKQDQRTRAVALRIHCVGNFKGIGLSFRIMENDNDGYYPMNIGFKDPTLREAAMTGGMFRVFQVMSNELSVPQTINCPADTRAPAAGWSSLSNSNISYFIGLDGEPKRPNMMVSGDRNLAIEGQLLAGVVALGTNSSVTWTREMHDRTGNIALADGSVQQVIPRLLHQQLKHSGDATNLLVFPQ